MIPLLQIAALTLLAASPSSAEKEASAEAVSGGDHHGEQRYGMAEVPDSPFYIPENYFVESGLLASCESQSDCPAGKTCYIGYCFPGDMAEGHRGDADGGGPRRGYHVTPPPYFDRPRRPEVGEPSDGGDYCLEGFVRGTCGCYYKTPCYFNSYQEAEDFCKNKHRHARVLYIDNDPHKLKEVRHFTRGSHESFWISGLHIYSGRGGLSRCQREPAFENSYCWRMKRGGFYFGDCQMNGNKAICEHPLLRSQDLK